MEKIQNLCTNLYVVGKTGLGKNLTPAGARWAKLVLVLMPSGRSGKEEQQVSPAPAPPHPRCMAMATRTNFFFWTQTQLFVLLQPAGGSGSLDSSA